MKARARTRSKLRHTRANHGVKPTIGKCKPRLKTGTKK